MKWSIRALTLQLKYDWAISRNTSTQKQNFIVSCKKNGHQGIGEVAPNIRYNESPQLITEKLLDFQRSAPRDIIDLTQFEAVLDGFNLPAALRFGIESAYIHLLANIARQSVTDFLQLPPVEQVSTSYSIPIMKDSQIENFWQANNLQRFKRLKIKVEKNTAVATIKSISSFTSQPMIIDANESWNDAAEFLSFQDKISSANIDFFEQPFPAHLVDQYLFLKPRSGYNVFADESITTYPAFEKLEEQFHGVNVKLMKAGGYLNSIRQLKEAHKRGMKTMIGCMVETTIGILSGLYLSPLVDFIDLDGFLIIKDEEFQLVEERNGLLFYS